MMMMRLRLSMIIRGGGGFLLINYLGTLLFWAWGRGWIWDKLGSFFTFQGNLFHRVSCSIISTISPSVFVLRDIDYRRRVGGMSSPAAKRVRRTDPTQSWLWSRVSPDKAGRLWVPITAPKSPPPMPRQQRFRAGADTAWLFFWRRRACATNCGRRVVLTCRRCAASSSSFCALWGGLIIMDGCLVAAGLAAVYLPV